jgi:hypothetical protein
VGLFRTAHLIRGMETFRLNVHEISLRRLKYLQSEAARSGLFKHCGWVLSRAVTLRAPSHLQPGSIDFHRRAKNKHTLRTNAQSREEVPGSRLPLPGHGMGHEMGWSDCQRKSAQGGILRIHHNLLL